MSFDYPFIYFCDSFGIKMSLIIFIVFISLFLLCTISFIKQKDNRNKRLKVPIFLVCLFIPLATIWSFLMGIGSDNLLISFFRVMLDYELIIEITMISVIVGGVITYKNRLFYLKSIVLPMLITVYVFMLASFLTFQVYLCMYLNFIWIIFFGIVSYFILNIDFSKSRVRHSPINSEGTEDSYGKQIETPNDKPIEKEEELFAERKWQLDDLINQITRSHSTPESLSICISAEWGQGKTSFINAMFNKLEEIEKAKKLEYPVIRIQALEIESLETLFAYFFNNIKYLLKKNGYYVGFKSEFEDYVSSIIKLMSESELKPEGILKQLFSSSTDYRENKKNLEKLVAEMLVDSKVIIVVDDLDRCTEEQVKNYVIFLKEIASFSNCYILFLVDYSELINIAGEKYLEKFVNQIVELRKIPFANISDFLLKKDLYLKNCGVLNKEINNIILRITNVLSYLSDNLKDEKKTLNEINENSKNEEDKEKRIKIAKSNCNEIAKSISLFEKFLSNPRIVKRILFKIQNFQSQSSFYVLNKYSGEVDVNFYLEEIKHIDIFIALSIISIVFPEKYSAIQESGLVSFLENIQNNDDNDIHDRIILSLGKGIWFSDKYLHLFLNSQFSYQKAVEYSDYLIQSPNELGSIVNTDKTFDDKLLNLFLQNKFRELELNNLSNCQSIFRIIVQKYALPGDLNCLKLFDVVADNTREQNLFFDELIKFFSNDIVSTLYYKPTLQTIKNFYDVIINSTTPQINDTRFAKRYMESFAKSYVFGSQHILEKIMLYHFSISNEDTFEKYKVFKKNLPEGHDFKDALNKICNAFAEENVIEKSNDITAIGVFIRKLEGTIKIYLTNDIYDFKDDFSSALSLIEEYHHLEKLFDYIDNQNRSIKCTESLSNENIDACISNLLTRASNHQESDTALHKDIDNLLEFTYKLSKNKMIEANTIHSLENLLNVSMQNSISYSSPRLKSFLLSIKSHSKLKKS